MRSVESISQSLTAETNRRKRDRLAEGLTEAEDRDQLLKDDLHNRVTALAKPGRRRVIDWSDLDSVKAQTLNYLEACAQTGTYPSVMGLCAHGFGCPRSVMNRYIQNNPNTETAVFLQIVKEIMADVLTNASLHNKANVAQVIFQLKNHFEHRDMVEIQAAAEPQMSDRITPDEIMARIAELDE